MKIFCWLLTLSLVMIPGSVTTQVRPRPDRPLAQPQIYDDGDAYDVYSAVLPMGSQWWQNSKTLLIVQEIPPKEWPIGSPKDALHGDAAFEKTFAEIFESFDEANQQDMLLEYDLTIQKPYKLVTDAELKAAFQHLAPNGIHDGWEGFRSGFPDSGGYLILSAVGFNHERTVALVYIEYRCGNMCDMARYYILEKRQGLWIKCTPKGLKSETTGIS